MQHAENAIGFRRDAAALREDLSKQRRVGVKERIYGLVWFYSTTYAMLEIVTMVLRLRFPEASKKRQAELSICTNGWRTVPRLLRLHRKMKRAGYGDNGAALALAQAYVSNAVVRLYRRFARRKMAAKLISG